MWLKALPTHGLQPIKCGSLSLDTPQVAAVERLVAEQQNNITKTFKLKVKPWTLYKVHGQNSIVNRFVEFHLCGF